MSSQNVSVENDVIENIVDRYNTIRKTISATIKTDKKKVGRKKGQLASKIKYAIEFHNIPEDKWVELGRFPSLRQASKKLNLSYGLLTDISIGRRQIYHNFYRVKKL